MKTPVLNEKRLIPAVAGMVLISVVGLVLQALLLPGWMYVGTIELLILAIIYGAFAVNFSPIMVRYGILCYVLGTGLMVVAQRSTGIMGEFSFGSALGPFMGSVGLFLGLTWFVPVMLSYAVAERFSENIYVGSLIGGLLVMVPGIFLLHNAASLDFFYWADEHSVIKPIIVWFVVGFFLHFAGRQMQVRSSNPAALPLYITWFAFNLALFVINLLR